MIHADTSFLIQALVRGTSAATKLEAWISAGEVLRISAIAWSEFVCGPLTVTERELARTLVDGIEPFITEDAERAAELFNSIGRRSRSLADCQIAAVALRCGARVATQNLPDFQQFRAHGLVLV